MNETVAVAKLRACIERVGRIEADIAGLNGADVYSEFRGDGFDVKTVRKIVARRKLDTTIRDEQDALFELCCNALTTGAARMHVHEESKSPETADTGLDLFNGARLGQFRFALLQPSGCSLASVECLVVPVNNLAIALYDDLR
jgi:uncharacterized protein (UPF0335 family)